MDRKRIMKAEKAASLSAFVDFYGMTAYEQKLKEYFHPEICEAQQNQKVTIQEAPFPKQKCTEKNTDKDRKSNKQITGQLNKGMVHGMSGSKCTERIVPGQEIVLSGYIGLAGTVYLAEEYTEKLEQTLPAHFIRSGAALKPAIAVLPDPEDMVCHGVKAMYHVGEGGLLNALCELASDSRTGFRIDYERVPVKQVTIEFCEVFDLNPWQLMSGGCVMMITDRGYETVSACRSMGIPCEVIGYISADNDKVICHDEVRSCLNRPEPDELLKIISQRASIQ